MSVAVFSYCTFVHSASSPNTQNYYRAWIYRPSFSENKPKTLVFNDWKRAFMACFRENRIYKFRHRRLRRCVLAKETTSNSTYSSNALIFIPRHLLLILFSFLFFSPNALSEWAEHVKEIYFKQGLMTISQKINWGITGLGRTKFIF